MCEYERKSEVDLGKFRTMPKKMDRKSARKYGLRMKSGKKTFWFFLSFFSYFRLGP